MDLTALRTFISANPILAATLASLWGAVLIDLTSFAATKEPGSFVATFSLKTACLRYAQALVAGFIGNFAVASIGTLTALTWYAGWF